MDSTLLKNLAVNLRRERAARQISQDELADLCSLHRTYIGGIERCERNITLATLEKISCALSVDSLDLLRDKK